MPEFVRLAIADVLAEPMLKGKHLVVLLLGEKYDLEKGALTGLVEEVQRWIPGTPIIYNLSVAARLWDGNCEDIPKLVGSL